MRIVAILLPPLLKLAQVNFIKTFHLGQVQKRKPLCKEASFFKRVLNQLDKPKVQSHKQKLFDRRTQRESISSFPSHA